MRILVDTHDLQIWHGMYYSRFLDMTGDRIVMLNYGRPYKLVVVTQEGHLGVLYHRVSLVLIHHWQKLIEGLIDAIYDV